MRTEVGLGWVGLGSLMGCCESNDPNNVRQDGEGGGDERKQKWVEKVAPPFNL